MHLNNQQLLVHPADVLVDFEADLFVGHVFGSHPTFQHADDFVKGFSCLFKVGGQVVAHVLQLGEDLLVFGERTDQVVVYALVLTRLRLWLECLELLR